MIVQANTPSLSSHPYWYWVERRKSIMIWLAASLNSAYLMVFPPTFSLFGSVTIPLRHFEYTSSITFSRRFFSSMLHYLDIFITYIRLLYSLHQINKSTINKCLELNFSRTSNSHHYYPTSRLLSQSERYIVLIYGINLLETRGSLLFDARETG